MAVQFITVQQARDRSGALATIDSTVLSDARVTDLIERVEFDMERYLNTSFVPKLRIDVLDGDGTERIFVEKNPLLAVRGCNVDGTTVTPANLFVFKESGMIKMRGSSESAIFTSIAQSVRVKYLYGLLDLSSTSTTTTAASTAGTSVALTVASISGFSDTNWVEITGMDGFTEVAQISGSPTGSTITVDELVFAHESGSTITLLQIPEYVKTYMILEAAIAMAVTAIGVTHTFNASYSLGDLSVVKGVPHTHWQAAFEKLIKERDVYKKRVKIRPSITR